MVTLYRLIMKREKVIHKSIWLYSGYIYLSSDYKELHALCDRRSQDILSWRWSKVTCKRCLKKRGEI